LVNGGLPPLIRTLVLHRAHWEHARVVLEARCGLTGDIARHAYEALLKLWHDRDPDIRRVFSAGRDLIRLPGRWTTADGGTPYTMQYAGNLLASLPACQLPDGAPNKERIDRFRQQADLTDFGYPPITLIRGCRIYSHHMDFPDPDRITAVAPNDLLRPG